MDSIMKNAEYSLCARVVFFVSLGHSGGALANLSSMARLCKLFVTLEIRQAC